MAEFHRCFDRSKNLLVSGLDRRIYVRRSILALWLGGVVFRLRHLWSAKVLQENPKLLAGSKFLKNGVSGNLPCPDRPSPRGLTEKRTLRELRLSSLLTYLRVPVEAKD